MKKLNTKFLVTLLILFFSIFYSIPAIFENHKSFPKFYDPKSIRLGLDLQGGSHLLLEVDTNTVLKEKSEYLVDDIRAALRKEKIKYSNLGSKLSGAVVTITDKKLTNDDCSNDLRYGTLGHWRYRSMLADPSAVPMNWIAWHNHGIPKQKNWAWHFFFSFEFQLWSANEVQSRMQAKCHQTDRLEPFDRSSL